jgi:purine-binding chemotaxis protein CheW
MISEPSVFVGTVPPGPVPREYLSFTLAGEDYAIDILCVREIRADEPVTRIAGVPEHVRGVVNLRGVIVPVIDLRCYFGLGATAAGGNTVIVVLEVGERLVGMRVDALADVVVLAPGEIRPAPELGATPVAQHVCGLANADGRVLIVLDILDLLRSPVMALCPAGDGGAVAGQPS